MQGRSQAECVSCRMEKPPSLKVSNLHTSPTLKNQPMKKGVISSLTDCDSNQSTSHPQPTNFDIALVTTINQNQPIRAPIMSTRYFPTTAKPTTGFHPGIVAAASPLGGARAEGPWVFVARGGWRFVASSADVGGWMWEI